MRSGRIDHKIFIFHKLCNLRQGTAFAKRFIGPYVKAGKISGKIDYAKAGETVMKYPPAIVETVFDDIINKSKGGVTVKELLDGLQKEPSMYDVSVNNELVTSIKSRIHILVADKIKKLNREPDYQILGMAAAGLSEPEIKNALENHTPEILTQENILAAFNKVKNH